MAVTQNTYTGNGATVLYSFTFPYLETTDVKVTINGTPTTAYTFANATTIQFNTAPANGAAIRIYRDTDDASLAATFYSGSAIRAQDLNDNFTQNLYVTQEVNNNSVNIDGSNPMVGPLNMNGFQITNLPVPAVDTNAATKKYVDDRFGNLDIPGHTRWRKVATTSQTIFSGTGDYGGVLAYSPTREQVYINGALQQRSVDYAADNGTSVVFTAGLTVGDVVDIICVNNLTNSSVSNAGNITYSGQFTGQTSRTVAAKLGDVVSVKDFGAVGDGVTDDTAAIQAAINGLSGEFDVYANYTGNQYSGKPSQILYFPPGIYKITARLLVEKNNVAIRGEGWFSTTIKYVGSSIINEVIRFRNSHYCEISDIGLDGGLPFNPSLTETYGAKAGLCCDLTPFFTSKNLYIVNTRLQGLRAIHLWESYFENLQIRNTGWFGDGTLAGRGAGIHFSNDAAMKESSNVLGPGFESSNITFVKAKLVPVGCLVRCDVLAANVHFINPITENRDFTTHFSALSESKWYLNNTDNFRITNGYCYAHQQPFACNAKLFEVIAQNPGLHIDGYYWYAPRANPAYFPEITKGFDIDPSYPVQIDNFVINDEHGALVQPLTISVNGPIVYGSIVYKSPLNTVTPPDLFTGTSHQRWNGKISITDSDSPGTLHTEWDLTEAERKFDTNSGAYLEAFQCRAWVSFNGVTGAILGRSPNVSSIAKNSTGNYTVNFSPAMPDANYAAVVSANVINSASERPEVGGQSANNINVANRAGATYYDPSIFNVVIFR